MAPNFFSKFIKGGTPATHTRSRSDSPRGSSPLIQDVRSVARTATIPSTPPDVSPSDKAPGSDASLPTTTGTTNNSSDDSVKTPTTLVVNAVKKSSASKASLVSTSSSQPHVTVVPATPLSGSASLSSHPDEQLGDSKPDRPSSPDSNKPAAADRTTSQHSLSKSTDDLTPTQTPIPDSDTPSRPTTPTHPSSVGNQQNGAGNKAITTPPTTSSSSPMAKTLDPPSSVNEVRRSASNKSLNLNINHMRAATTPETMRDTGHGESGTIVMMTPIVESPTSARSPEPFAQSQSFSSSLEPKEGSVTVVTPRDSDTASLVPPGTTNGTKDKKRPWRRSTTRKPTGLAGAIAASGMAMAHHGLSAAHQSSFNPVALQTQQPNSSSSAKKASNSGSPPYLTRSPTGSSNHVKGKSIDLSPRSARSRRSGSLQSGVRRTSVSVKSDNASEYYPEDRVEYYSGLEGSSDEEDNSVSDESMGLDLAEDDIPVTGFAVASHKRNADFHELFPNVPEGDYLIDDYGCALQREILIQGRLYVSENHICFHANIFGWITDLSIPLYEITQLEKRMTAFVIPNAIQITTRQAKYTFASFLSRDTTYDVIYSVWRLARPDEDGISSGRPSLEAAPNGHPPQLTTSADLKSVSAEGHKPTQCICGKEGKHYSEIALDTIVPGTPEKINNLMFTSGFIKDFMTVHQKLLDVQMSDWQPTSPGSNLLARNMSYIKPLNASVGPRQTKCEIRDEMVYNDTDNYISTVTTTRTPDVPSGSVFSVKTRTCLMWASAISTRLVVTTQVEWTGRSFIKGIIERSAIDGQKTYHLELEAEMRKYIQEHQSEFIPQGIDTSALVPETTPSPTALTTTAWDEKLSEEEARKKREHERNRRGLQWAWDTFDGAYQVALRSTKGALELVRDAWEQSTTTTIMWFVIVLLVLSNLWTLIIMGSREEAGRRKEMKKLEEREKWVQSVVRALWDEFGSQNKAILTGPLPSNPAMWRNELGELQNMLDQMEQRIKALRESATAIQSGDMNNLD